MNREKISATQAVRLAVQIICFLFIPSLYIGALSGIQQIWTAAVRGSFSAALWPQILEVLAIVPVTVVVGRFFCGWMCAFGAFTDFLWLAVHKIFKKKRRIPEQADRVMKYIKYIVLAVLVLAVWTFGATLFRSASPWDAFGMLAAVGKTPDFSYVVSNLTAGLIILAAVMILSAVYERFFCRYLCPLGAFFALASHLRLAKIRKPSAGCGNCRACTNACAMGIPLYRMDTVRGGECIDCMKCVSVCPRGNARLAVAQSDVRPLAAGVAAAAVMAGVYYGGGFAVNSAGLASPGTSSLSTAGTAAGRTYRDGTYTGTGIGFRSAATKVSVAIANDKITAVNVVSYGDDERFFQRAYTQVSQEIISSQSAEVDTVSGATYSSNGIMQAVADALEQAKLSSVAASASSASSETAESSSSAAATGASSQSALTSGGSSQTSAGSYKDGTYTGTGTGFRGETQVTVTVSGGKIAAVNADSYQDDDRFFQRAYPQVSQEIVGSQSAEVDAVSGATYSSRGIMQAVANALEKAAK